MRISDHFLEIERGRYRNIQREKRICQKCNLNEVEDEVHFFFICPKYIQTRIDFENNIYNENPILKSVK